MSSHDFGALKPGRVALNSASSRQIVQMLAVCTGCPPNNYGAPERFLTDRGSLIRFDQQGLSALTIADLSEARTNDW